jgi:integrase/recombinase XerD
MLEELQRRNYAQSTANQYIRIVREFAKHYDQAPDQLGPDQIREYSAYLFRERKLAQSTVQQHVAGLRFFYLKTLKRHFLLEDLPMPKRSRRIPEILSPEEVTRLIDSASNLFHRTMLMTLYSTGIRRAELCRLPALSQVPHSRPRPLVSRAQQRTAPHRLMWPNPLCGAQMAGAFSVYHYLPLNAT